MSSHLCGVQILLRDSALRRDIDSTTLDLDIPSSLASASDGNRPGQARCMRFGADVTSDRK